MDRIREQLGNPLVTGVIGLVLGAIIGLTIFGWLLFPVQWKDASPALLRSDLKEDYLRMAITTYSKDQDKLSAQNRWKELGPDAPDILAAVQANPKVLPPNLIAEFTTVVQAGSAVAPSFPGLPTTAATTAPNTAKKPNNFLTIFLGVMCAGTLIVAAFLAYTLVLRNRRSLGVSGEPTSPSPVHQEASRVERAFAPISSKEPPVAQFMTTYMAGDDMYDDSFSIDSPTGEFMGECGVGMSETIGVGDPKKVTAFEVWLFDKNDIQTVTKVLMSDHAFNDSIIHQKLESKGEPVSIEPGKRILLETATLQLEARVVDLNYGQGALPPCSFFDRLTLELSVWPKQNP
ncbi:MAG: hypothetical protein PHQ40_01210 [Anaerolineaceae bacterium]|nr:hypothetical protein [Anaerolineaceae bacterium]